MPTRHHCGSSKVPRQLVRSSQSSNSNSKFATTFYIKASTLLHWHNSSPSCVLEWERLHWLWNGHVRNILCYDTITMPRWSWWDCKWYGMKWDAETQCGCKNEKSFSQYDSNHVCPIGATVVPPQSIYLTYRLLPLKRISPPFLFHSISVSSFFPSLDSQMVGSDLHAFA